MITFTEHNEVVMSVDDMRHLVRLIYINVNEDYKDETIMKFPLTFRVESQVIELERWTRKYGKLPPIPESILPNEIRKEVT